MMKKVKMLIVTILSMSAFFLGVRLIVDDGTQYTFVYDKTQTDEVNYERFINELKEEYAVNDDSFTILVNGKEMNVNDIIFEDGKTIIVTIDNGKETKDITVKLEDGNKTNNSNIGSNNGSNGVANNDSNNSDSVTTPSVTTSPSQENGTKPTTTTNRVISKSETVYYTLDETLDKKTNRDNIFQYVYQTYFKPNQIKLLKYDLDGAIANGSTPLIIELNDATYEYTLVITGKYKGYEPAVITIKPAVTTTTSKKENTSGGGKIGSTYSETNFVTEEGYTIYYWESRDAMVYQKTAIGVKILHVQTMPIADYIQGIKDRTIIVIAPNMTMQSVNDIATDYSRVASVRGGTEVRDYCEANPSACSFDISTQTVTIY